VIGTPRLSIGLPVYNGQNYLAEALDSLLAQSYEDFELVISDNASTDRTADICRDYAARDPRIRYIRQPENIGGAPNQDFVFRQSRGQLFKWAAHDDVYGRDLLARCVEVLDERPEVVLCHADMAHIDENSEVLDEYEYALATASPDPAERLRSLLVTDGGDDEYGVMRSAVLRKVKPCGSYHNPGRPFIAEVALHGPFHQVRELLFYRREHPDRGDRNPTIRAVSRNMDPRRAGQSTARLVGEYVLAYVTAVQRSPLSAADRRRCYGELIRYAALRSGSGVRRTVARTPVARLAGATR
jgi:glycosyltransferase involved in cell wall biosynthesis